MNRGCRLMNNAVLLFVAMLLLSSCASLSPNGVGRVKHYSFGNEDLSEEFVGYKVAFMSDIHYPSLFTREKLAKVVRKIKKESPDILLLGGDYVTADTFFVELFDSLSSVRPADGIFAVLGNHERRYKGIVEQVMDDYGVVLLSDTVVAIERGEEAIHIAGIHDSFVYDSLVVQPAETMAEDAFVILLCHTPDYAERSSTTADLVFSGHTHGGQVSLFGIYTPVKNTIYGRRFLRGMNATTSGASVITTTGVGTSRRKIRFCVPSEIVFVTLGK
ncbi:MAG: metallophosphoesterase [Bacteroidaceae bacterium]|nr:metallophosphoesterase [Bacteroidaceae bacterium]